VCSRGPGALGYYQTRRARRVRREPGTALRTVEVRKGLAGGVRGDPIVCGQSLARRSTSAGCLGPIVGSSPVAWEEVLPLALEVQRGLEPGRRVAVAGSLDGPEVDSLVLGEGSLGLEGGIAGVDLEEGTVGAAGVVHLGRRMSLKLRGHRGMLRLVRRVMSLWVVLCGACQERDQFGER
jgi:hypothetical protein